MKNICINDIINCFKEYNVNLYSLTFIYNGNVKTQQITPSSLCHNSYSIAKVFTMSAIGMLYDEGLLSTSEKIYDILKEYFPNNYDKKWENVTIDDCLLHKMGIAKGLIDIDCDNIYTYGTDDFLKYAFSNLLSLNIGEQTVYSDDAYYILSRIVAKKSGEDIFLYLRKHLFTKLNFQEYSWSVCPQGYSIGATGLYIKTSDMAKLGQVYLNEGLYNNIRILSSTWVKTVLQKGYELKPRYIDKDECYSKGGMYGQMLWISKTNNLVIAWHAFDNKNKTEQILQKLNM